MITLPNLAVSDANLTGAETAAKTTGSPEDFLALLAGALTQLPGTGGEKIAQLANEEVDTTHSLKTPAQSLTQWLMQQDAASTTSDVDLTTAGDAQTLLSSLAAHLKGELKAGKESAKASDSDDKTAESKLSDDELKSLNALMAMLPVTPQIQPATSTAVPTQTSDALNTLTASLGRSGGKAEGFVDVKGTPASQVQTDARALPADSAFVIPAQKAEAESAPSPAAPTSTLTPVTAQTVTPAAASAAAATANIHAQLGTPDWQQNVSQHITLFTRQGQQTAELRLHPESLGQVHITLKVEDNLAQIQMASPHSHVRAALEAALPVLRSQLEDNGIQLGQSNISSDGFAGQQQQSSSQHAFASRGESGAADGQDEGDVLAVPAALQSAARGDNAVDIFA
ncbi:MAG: flagellar hook-length control protein FliK [Kluyvera cryocrescens]|uniref:flagellar hook-length control protein FliK n=1 Tax=Kluyvera cryocrescens TaxID=580 RepID=UPI000D8289D7|nr:flagellar hook-length control protein FliK [Kluyvera cryocrescens]MCX2869491.1 flagellar hook-length control protein FliK [Kluyvera cryocrescens]MDU5686961.1 flagellar hook-length control protein FliK [Kluyvera cryocrescens]SQC33488.1 Flagellar hook-length control protein [Kluyvera cryocrescens]